jgi:hypothetical protein
VAIFCWRLANVRSQWQKLWAVLLLQLMRRTSAAAWYERFGALTLLDDPLRLVLPLETIRATVA